VLHFGSRDDEDDPVYACTLVVAAQEPYEGEGADGEKGCAPDHAAGDGADERGEAVVMEVEVEVVEGAMRLWRRRV
jgi:hypothetical protein